MLPRKGGWWERRESVCSINPKRERRVVGRLSATDLTVAVDAEDVVVRHFVQEVRSTVRAWQHAANRNNHRLVQRHQLALLCIVHQRIATVVGVDIIATQLVRFCNAFSNDVPQMPRSRPVA